MDVAVCGHLRLTDHVRFVFFDRDGEAGFLTCTKSMSIFRFRRILSKLISQCRWGREYLIMPFSMTDIPYPVDWPPACSGKTQMFNRCRAAALICAIEALSPVLPGDASMSSTHLPSAVGPVSSTRKGGQCIRSCGPEGSLTADESIGKRIVVDSFRPITEFNDLIVVA